MPINLETVIVGIEKNEENIWGLLLGTGYLKSNRSSRLSTRNIQSKNPKL